MKKIISMVIALSVLSFGVVCAAPLNDFSQGKTSAEFSITNPKLETSDSSGTTDWNKKTDYDFGVTVGLGNNHALQYKYQNMDSDTTYGYATAKADVQEFNYLTKINNNMNWFVGLHHLSGSLDYVYSYDIKEVTKLQAGITGVYPVNNTTTEWFTVGLGDSNYTVEAGVGYAIAQNTDLNLFYRYKKFTDLELDGYSRKIDAEPSGFGLGVSVKF